MINLHTLKKNIHIIKVVTSAKVSDLLLRMNQLINLIEMRS